MILISIQVYDMHFESLLLSSLVVSIIVLLLPTMPIIFGQDSAPPKLRWQILLKFPIKYPHKNLYRNLSICHIAGESPWNPMHVASWMGLRMLVPTLFTKPSSMPQSFSTKRTRAWRWEALAEDTHFFAGEGWGKMDQPGWIDYET